MALYTIRSGVNNHPERTVLQFTTDMVRRGGVISGFAASEKTGGATMSVDVAAGTLYAENAAEAYPVNNDGIVNVSVPLNTSANAQIDTLLCYVDLELTPVASGGGAGIAQFVVIPGTPSTSPEAPSGADITATIGTNMPYELLANIYVAAQATAITNENITDLRRTPYIKSMREVSQLSASGSLTLDTAQTDTFEVTMNGNITLNVPSGMKVGDWIYVTFIQGSSTARTLNYAAFTAMSADMSLSSGAGARSNFAIQRTSSNYAIYAAGRQY